ncbi:TIGR02611 family protein [Micromonospora fiedleri]|uniref:TIGR02611 family protein n=1 Tax=Micromonospora fiedleri TaxID=1157498 RepID=UPI003F686775
MPRHGGSVDRRGPRDEQRGYGVPKKQEGQRGRSTAERRPTGGDRNRRNSRRPANGQAPARRGNHPLMQDERVQAGQATRRERRGVTMPERRDRPRWRRRVSTTLALIRSNPTGRLALRVIIGVLGALVVAVGILLIPLPGPGWLIVIAGLGIWAVEFHWAKRLLTFTRRHVHGWANWVKRQSLAVRFVLGAVGIVFVGAVALISIKLSLDIDVIAQVLRYFATH